VNRGTPALVPTGPAYLRPDPHPPPLMESVCDRPSTLLSMAQITRDEVAHVARLARLLLTDEEIDTFTEQLGKVLDRDVEALDVGDVPPTAHPYPLVNVVRPDEEVPCLDREAVLAAAPDTEDGRFRVPPVLGEAP
jgi:aspartyl-tRNA(Asn)/glutamyl-tRNA(Gln) amidotransferase subunit C